jgi:hypothetical protein
VDRATPRTDPHLDRVRGIDQIELLEITGVTEDVLGVSLTAGTRKLRALVGPLRYLVTAAWTELSRPAHYTVLLY